MKQTVDPDFKRFTGDELWLVRIPDLVDARPPLDCVFVDEALNLVGRTIAPDRWGKSSIWAQHPFRYQTDKTAFCRFVAARDEDDFWYIEITKIKARCAREILLEADRLYQQAVDKLSEALQAGVVKAWTTKKGERTPIRADAWTTSRVAFFYTGHCFWPKVEHFSKAKFKTRIFVERASLQRLLDLETHAQSRGLSSSASEDIVLNLIALANEFGIQYKRDELFRALQAAFSSHGLRPHSERQFLEKIWGDPRIAVAKFPRGAPSKALVDKMDCHLQKVCETIANARKHGTG